MEAYEENTKMKKRPIFNKKQMRKHIAITLSCFLFMTSCLKEGSEEETIDLSAPTIKALAGQASVQPEFFFKTDANIREVPVAFTIEDASGIREVKIESHSGFDGHTHGKSTSARNPKFKLFNHNQVLTVENFEDEKRFTYNSSIYLDERNPDLEPDELILGGPYHFSIQATDVEGNETTYRDNTTYHTTLYLNKPYAPQVDFTGTDLTAKRIGGRIFKNPDHEASSDLIFVWVYLQAANSENPNQEGNILKERIWGQSNWPHQFRANGGAPLPDTLELDLFELLGNDTDFLESLGENKLVVWAEDSFGNISVNQFNN